MSFMLASVLAGEIIYPGIWQSVAYSSERGNSTSSSPVRVKRYFQGVRSNLLKAKVTMVCKETWRAEAILEVEKGEDAEAVKDRAWAQFDELCPGNLEQDNHTKIEWLDQEPNERG